jgi:predicted metalloprotease
MRWCSDRRSDNIEDRGGRPEEGAAAAAIGDDQLQRDAGRAVNPESFTWIIRTEKALIEAGSDYG